MKIKKETKPFDEKKVAKPNDSVVACCCCCCGSGGSGSQEMKLL